MFIFKAILAAFSAIIAENLVLTRGIGSSTMLIAGRDKKQLLGISLGITYFSVACSALIYFINKSTAFTLDELFLPLWYIIITSVVYIVTLLLLLTVSKSFFSRVKSFIHLSAFNCTVLGTLLINSQQSTSFGEYITFGFNSGLGFMIAAYMLKIVNKRLNSADIPESFRGYPITMIYLGILSMALYSFIR